MKVYPLRTFRHWRWGRAEGRNVARLAGNRTPVQVCPRGCEFRELARRDLLTKTRWGGRAVLHLAFAFETTNCPECGAALARKCGRCDHDILAPAADLCRFCGLPQPWATERRTGAERADLRAWWPQAQDEEGKGHANDPALPLYESFDRGDLWIIEGDIAHLEVDAVISNDDVDGRMWAQVARAIKSAAGEGIERLAQEGKPFPLGHAWMTPAGGLRQMKGIIHVASMSRRGKVDLEVIRESLAAALAVASKEGYESLGVAPIGSGPTTIDPGVWYRMFAEVVVEHFSSRKSVVAGGSPKLSIVLVLFEPLDFQCEVERMEAAIFDAWRGARKPADGSPGWRRPAVWHRLADRLRR